MSAIRRTLAAIWWLLRPVRWVLRLLRRIITWPFRTYREHISAQLVASHTLVVILAVLLAELVVVAVLAALVVWQRGDDISTDYTLGFDAELVANAVMASPGRQALLNPATATDTERASMATLMADVEAENPLALPPIVGDGRAADDGVADDPWASLDGTLGLIDLVVVFDRDGVVRGTSNPEGMPLGATIGDLQHLIARNVTTRVQELNGQPTAYGNTYVLDAADGRTVAASPLQSDTGEVVGYVLLETPVMIVDGVTRMRDLVLFTAAASVVLLIVAAIPALVVSLPVGIWRGRRMARRVNALALAAEQVAAGDLTRRVAVRGQDEIAALSRDFNRMAARLDESDRSRRAFVANVSHELRTPVAIIQGNLERLLNEQEQLQLQLQERAQAHERAAALAPVAVGTTAATPRSAHDADDDTGTDADADADAHNTQTPSSMPDLDALIGGPGVSSSRSDIAGTLQMLHSETQTLSRLIDDLFTIARIEEAQLALDLRALDLRTIVQQAVDGISGVAWEQRRVTVQSVLGEGLPRVRGDETRIRQVLNNLLYNALRHTPEGGLVIVDANASASEQMVEISVADTGMGIPAAELERVFERFHRVERQGRHADGSGLGLAIVRQLVEAMGGSITAESTPGVGSVFRVHLPRAS